MLVLDVHQVMLGPCKERRVQSCDHQAHKISRNRAIGHLGKSAAIAEIPPIGPLRAAMLLLFQRLQSTYNTQMISDSVYQYP